MPLASGTEEQFQPLKMGPSKWVFSGNIKFVNIILQVTGRTAKSKDHLDSLCDNHFIHSYLITVSSHPYLIKFNHVWMLFYFRKTFLKKKTPKVVFDRNVYVSIYFQSNKMPPSHFLLKVIYTF